VVRGLSYSNRRRQALGQRAAERATARSGAERWRGDAASTGGETELLLFFMRHSSPPLAAQGMEAMTLAQRPIICWGSRLSERRIS